MAANVTGVLRFCGLALTLAMGCRSSEPGVPTTVTGSKEAPPPQQTPSAEISAVARFGGPLLLADTEAKVVAWSPDGKLLASGGGADKAVLLWDAATGVLAAKLADAPVDAAMLEFSADGTLLVAAEVGHSMIVWNVTDRKVVHRLEREGDSFHSMTLSPDKQRIAFLDGGGVISLWELATKGPPRKVASDARVASSIAFSPDGRAILVPKPASLSVLDSTSFQNIAQTAVDGDVSKVVFSPSGRRLMTAEFEKSRHVATVRDAKTRAVLARFSGHGAAIYDLAMTPDERIAVTGSSDGTVRVWDAASGRELRTLDANLAHPARTTSIWSIAVSPDGTRVAAAGNDRLIRMWTIATGDALLAAHEHHGAIGEVAFSPDGRVLASSDQAGHVRVRDASTGRVLFRLPPATRALSSLAFSPDGRLLMTQTSGGETRYWDASTGAARGDLPGVRSGALTFTPDGSGVLARDTSRIVRLFAATSGAEIRAFGVAQPHDDERANLGTPSSVSVSPDGKHLAVARWDQQIHVWDLASGALVRTVPGLLHVQYSPDGKLFATALGQISKRATKLQLGLVDAMTGAVVHTLPTGVEAAFAPDGKTLAALHEGALEIWSTMTGQRLRRTAAHGAISFVLSADGKRVATGGSDGTVTIWALE